jgi:beta-lactamase regulating signal transducer with metallopeptidase domain
MHSVIYLPFALSAVVVGLSRLVSRRTPPRRATWMLTAVMVSSALAFVGALGLLAWPLLARLPLIAHLGRWRPTAVDRGVPVPLAVSLVAFGALLVVACRAVGCVRGLRRAYVDTARLHAEFAAEAGSTIIVVQEATPAAHAVPATLSYAGRVVVTTGLLEELDVDERTAVVAHERAHLIHRHQMFAMVTALAAALNPILVLARADVAFAMERWADEEAAARTSPTVVARALARAALARLSTSRSEGSLGISLALTAHAVPDRVGALLATRRYRVELVWVLGGVAVIAVAAVGFATHDTERIFEALRTR